MAALMQVYNCHAAKHPIMSSILENLTRWGLDGRPNPEAGWEARALFFWGVSLAMSPVLPDPGFCRGALGSCGSATLSPLAKAVHN